jgi:hypothetical protein
MDHCAKTAESLKDSHGLLEATGLFDTQARVANSKREEYVTQDVTSPSRIHALRQELERKARVNRLILVSKATLAAAVREVCLHPLFERYR